MDKAILIVDKEEKLKLNSN